MEYKEVFLTDTEQIDFQFTKTTRAKITAFYIRYAETLRLKIARCKKLFRRKPLF